ncbi:glycosyltransferase family 39 protein [Antrihabitans sp. YC2-6]|uniref:glycosyltransferase family 39 protein n=1 Tax=Antrihabitans sp. YC2-6 TaxID=2799498 RepID=UPI0018F2DB61|nr:glycosyltransferase family 39 protein [Antrihabitans sp. YC2-6]MBJ8346878.1 glycosyltransferase family 39 protein [Antrihabitans sp. YC2-6]
MNRGPVFVFGSAFAAYLAFGLTLSVRFGFMMGDALSRTSAAQAVLFSRDPHVGAIGFIFTPLTALLQLPIVAFSQWWPTLTRYNITGITVSAVFMAGAVVMVHGICRDRGCGAIQSGCLTALFALNPIIASYGANGMSEAVFLFFICWAVRRLIRWCHSDDVHDLLLAGLALAFGYLTRYDAVAAIAAAAFLVVVVTLSRNGWGHAPTLVRRAILDAVLVAAPGTAAFIVWSATSWLITGQALAQFSSAYGNSAILEQSGGGPTGGRLANLVFALNEIFVLAPALVIMLGVVGVLAWRRRDLEFVVAPLLFGSVLAFQAASYALGTTFGFMRFYICAVPLLIVLAAQLTPAREGAFHAKRPGAFIRDPRPAPRHTRALAFAGVAAVVVGIPITAYGVLEPRLAPQQYALGYLLDDSPSATPSATIAKRIIASFGTERRLAEYLDAKELPPGSILTDTVYGFAVIAASSRPEQFVVPSDEDFTEVLNDPGGYGVRYILTVPNRGRGESDAVNRRYPTIWENGAGVGTLSIEVPNDGADQPVWRVFEVLGRR